MTKREGVGQAGNKTVVMSIRMDEQTYEQLTRLARKARRARVDYLRILIQDTAQAEGVAQEPPQ